MLVAVSAEFIRSFEEHWSRYDSYKEFEFSGPSSLDSVSANVKSENTRSDADSRQMAPDVAVIPKAMLSQKISIH